MHQKRPSILIYIVLLACDLQPLIAMVLGGMAQASVLHVIKKLLIANLRCKAFPVGGFLYVLCMGQESFSPVAVCSAAGFP